MEELKYLKAISYWTDYIIQKNPENGINEAGRLDSV